MSILSFFKPTWPIPTAEDTGIGLQATQKAYEAVKRVMSEQQAKQPAKKRKIYTTFTDQQRACGKTNHSPVQCKHKQATC